MDMDGDQQPNLSQGQRNRGEERRREGEEGRGEEGRGEDRRGIGRGKYEYTNQQSAVNYITRGGRRKGSDIYSLSS